MLKNATWKASLLAEASMLQHKQLLANQELQVNQIKEELRLRTELAKIEALEKVCDEFSSSKITPRSRATHDGHDFSQIDTLQSRPPLLGCFSCKTRTSLKRSYFLDCVHTMPADFENGEKCDG